MTMHFTSMILNFLTLQGDKLHSQQSTPVSQMQEKKTFRGAVIET